MSSSRDAILARIREATADAPDPAPPAQDHRALVDLLAENLADYRARVHRAAEAELPAVVARLLAGRGARSVAVPPGLPAAWLADTVGVDIREDTAEHPLTALELDGVDSVLTGCRVAVAVTGTIVLDAGPAQGRRVLTLAPDHHICVVRTADQTVASLAEALARLDPTCPLTWISGPSATSDIELDRVEGVHGPRTLDVILTG
ncbi:lactate utilization protein C [Streptomyces sp. NPDC021020]|uniref:lactate utilization protein C n=1 Tax=Streptomyces sp. NPDC021020 TaxID=3365109 RepID=UPI0037B1B41A